MQATESCGHPTLPPPSLLLRFNGSYKLNKGVAWKQPCNHTQRAPSSGQHVTQLKLGHVLTGCLNPCHVAHYYKLSAYAMWLKKQSMQAYARVSHMSGMDCVFIKCDLNWTLGPPPKRPAARPPVSDPVFPMAISLIATGDWFWFSSWLNGSVKDQTWRNASLL